MLKRKRCAKINVKVLIILIIVIVALGASLFAARQVRRRILSKMDYQAGQAAFEKEDWKTACKHFREYLGRNPDDIEILQKYAKAGLSIRPINLNIVNRSIATYRQIMRLNPHEKSAYETLTMLYAATGNYEDLAYIARAWISQDPNDFKGRLWLGEALQKLNKTEAKDILNKLIDDLNKELPNKHPEYVRACILMSQIILKEDSLGSEEKALEMLNSAIKYDPESAIALATRARFYRQTVNPNMREEERQTQLELAQEDLQAAHTLGTKNPRTCLLIAREWIAHGEFDRAESMLKAAESLPQEILQEQFLDLNVWTIAKFFLASEIEIQKRTVTKDTSLADEILNTLKDKRERFRILPTAIHLYVIAGKATEAKQCLDEYVEILYSQQGQTESREELAFLRAIVAKAEDDSYAVIDALQPAVVSNTSRPQVWSLLAEAFSRTDQTRRAVGALIKYLRLRPRDAEMRQQLTKEYLKLRDWSNALRVAQLGESVNTTEIILKLLRIEASVNIVAERQKMKTAIRQELADEIEELSQLRKEHSNNVDIRILQAIIAINLDDPDTAEKELKLAIKECDEPLRAEIQLSRFYYQTKRISEAISTCKSACENHPELAEPWLSLSSLYVANNDYKSARNCLKQAQDAVVGKWEKRSILLSLALLELTHGDEASGIRILSDIAAQDKREIRARILLLNVPEIRKDKAKVQGLIDELHEAEGDSGLMWRMYQAATWLTSDEWRAQQQNIESYIQFCIDSDPEWSYPPLLLAELYEKLQDPGRVEKIYRQALVRNSSATEIVDKLVTLLEKQGRFSDAERILQQSDTNSRFTSARHTILSLRAGEFTRAIEELKLRVSNDNQDADSRILLARLIYWQDKDADQAFEYLNQAETITSGSIAITAARVSILRAEGKGEEARKILNDYVNNSDKFEAYMMRAVYFVDEEEFERAEQDYKKLTTFSRQSATGYELLSNFYVRIDKYDKAIKAVEDGLDRHPENLRLKRLLMKILFLQNSEQSQPRALEILAALEEQLPQDPELMQFRAIQLLNDSTPESLDTARKKLENVIQLEPTAVDAHLMLISIAMQKQDYETARNSAIRAIGSNPENMTLVAARSKAEFELNNIHMAAQLAQVVLQNDPNNIEACEVLLGIALRSGDKSLLEQTKKTIESAISNNPNDEMLLISGARLLVAMNQPHNAIPALEAYCQTDQGSRSLSAIVTLADLYRISKNMDIAKQWIDKAETIDKNNQAFVHARCLWLVEQNKLKELEGISTSYLSAKEQNPATLLKAATILGSLDSTILEKEALILYEYAVKLPSTPSSKDAHLVFASNLYQTGKVEFAEKIYREMLVQYPNEVQVLNDLAWILQKHHQRYTDALELANKALRVESDNLNVLDTRGTILSNLPGRLADARNDFQKIVELSDHDSRQRAKALLQLGRICIKLNDLNQAKKHLMNALDIDQKINVFTPQERSEITRLQTR